MSARLHIIVIENEQKPHNFIFSKRKLQFAIFTSLTLILLLSIGSFQAIRLFQTNTNLTSQIAGLSNQLEKSKILKQELAIKVDDLQQVNKNHSKTSSLFNNALSELEERSQIIEQVMDNIGIDIEEPQKDTKNSGGPFIAPLDTLGKELLYRSDHYLEAIQHIPLGRPVPGPITSEFGHRKDPVNGKKGFHTGVDMRGRRGQKILATADGVVSKAFSNGGYGRYVELRHANGYTTSFAHMKKILVKKGDKIKRGQAIGTVGSSGRSTGPHLHYEICLWKKPVNPNKFMQVEQLTQLPSIPVLTPKATKKINKITIAQLEIDASLPREARHVSVQ